MARRRKLLAKTTAAERRARVAAVYLEGQPQAEIARLVKVNQGTVSRDLATIRAEWQARALRDFGDRQAEELAKLDKLEAEAWAAWKRSTRPATTTTAETVTDEAPAAPTDKAETAPTPTGAPVRSKAVKKVEQRDGNPQFLALVKDCIAKRCEILGLDAPKQHNIDVQVPDLRTVSDEHLLRLDATLADVFGPARLPTAPGGPGGTGPSG